jgi:hypothetical protein
MKCVMKLCCLVGGIFLLSGTAMATKPGEEVNPNGFPSGPHYNLNIHGKMADFTCPDVQLDEFGNPVYGNSIFVPDDGVGIEILMESGSGKGSKTETITELQVTDPCSAPIDNDPAVVQIPPNTNGYRVYARALATPTDNPWMTVTPELVSVEDEYGNDLLYLGLVTSDGFTTASETFTRTKGKSKAIPITGLFEWTGDVCYFNQEYCLDGECTSTDLCCTDADLDGVYESCEPNPDLLLCPEGSVDTAAYCTSYTNEWVFNIGDFVTYLWDVQNNGLKLLQVRFYPVE